MKLFLNVKQNDFERRRVRFRKYSRVSALVLIFAGALGVLNAQEPSSSIVSSINEKEIFLGESAVLTVSIQDSDFVSDPDVSTLQNDFDVKPLGSSKRTSVRTSYFGQGGQGNRIENTTIDYRYSITPKRTGRLKVASPIVTVGNTTAIGNDTFLVVKDIPQTDLAYIEAHISQTDSLYPLVPFELSVDVYIKGYPNEYRDIDPLSLIVRNTVLDAPNLNLPFLDDVQIDENFISDDSNDDWLRSFASNRYGFNVVNRRENPFDFSSSFFFESRRVYSLPQPERVKRSENDAEYWKYSFKRKLRPAKAGVWSFPSPTLKGAFLDFSDPEKPKATALFLVAPAVALDVKAIPEENAPDDYVGIYGKITQKTFISGDELAVGEAATLTVSFSGYGDFDGVVEPKISDVPEIANNFKVYPPTERALQDGVAFDYKIRPIKSGKITIPPLTASFFNVETGNFERLQSSPQGVNVREGVRVPSPDDASADAFDADTQSLQKNSTGSRYLEKSVKSSGFLLIIVLACFVLWKAMQRAVLRHRERVAESNRKIVQDGRASLEEALTTFDNSPTDGLVGIRLSFLQLVGNKFHQRLDSVTDEEFKDYLTGEFSKEIARRRPNDVSTTQDSLNEIRDFFQRAERYRFAGVAVSEPNFKDSTRRLYEKWIELVLLGYPKLVSVAARENSRISAASKARSH